MTKNSKTNLPAVTNTVSLLEAVLAISSQDGLEAAAHEACKQIAAMLDVFTVSFIKLDLVEQTGQLLTEFIRKDHAVQHDFYEPISYAGLPNFAKVIEKRNTFTFHKDDPALVNAPEMVLFEQFLARQIVIVPVMARNNIFGMLFLWVRSPDRVFNEQDIAFLELLANNVGIIVERTQLADQRERWAKELEVLHEISLTLSSRLELDLILKTIVEGVFQLDADVMCANVFLKSDDGLYTGFSQSDQICEELSEVLSEVTEFAMQVAISGKKIMIGDTQQSSQQVPWFSNIEIEALAGLPLKVGHESLGVIQIAYQNQKEFSTESIQILEMLADRAAMAIRNVQLLEEITRQALTDPLTEVANRRAFEILLEAEVARTNRTKSEFCLLFIDLDGFKQVNDRYGHPVGDKTLKQITNCFSLSLRESDILARMGGDEFVILLPDTGFAGGTQVAETLKFVIDNKCEFEWMSDPDPLALSISIGVVQFPDQADSIPALYQLGDEMLYKNKQQKKNI